jgi:transcriptional regulator with XRE-family HTH domain
MAKGRAYVPREQVPRRKGKTTIDLEIGKRIRAMRMHLGLSQTTLGKALGVTFQQMQKYENGTNRIGPSRLEIVARVLKVPVTSFFPSMDGKNAKPQTFDFLRISHATDLMSAFSRISNPRSRALLVELAERLAN